MTRETNYLQKAMRWMAAATGILIASPFSGCNQAVKEAFYGGLEDLAVSMVEAFFAAITPTSSASAGLFGTIQNWLA